MLARSRELEFPAGFPGCREVTAAGASLVLTESGRLVCKGGKQLDPEVNRHSSAIIMGRPMRG